MRPLTRPAAALLALACDARCWSARGADLAISRLVRQDQRAHPHGGSARELLVVARSKTELEASASIELAKHTLLSAGLILTLGIITGLLARKIRIPDVPAFLVVGMAIGPEMLGLIDIKADSASSQTVLLFGASYILFDGGASLRFSVLKQVWITILVISTIGVVITGAVTALVAYHVLGVSSIVALLLGATLASTDRQRWCRSSGRSGSATVWLRRW